jgi:hypothetical protein
MPGTENILKTTLVGDSKQLRQELSKAEKGLKQFGDKAKAIGKTMSLYVTAPVVAAGGFAIKMASDFQESLNKVDVAFKGSSNEVKKFAKTTLDSFGIAEGTALDMAALFGDMSTSMGLNTQEASKMSTALVGLAGDLSSFKNMNIEEVTTALNGVFTGETESLKRLGIVMTEVNLKQFALEKGIKTQIKDMTQAQKVQLRYQYVMEKTANAHGDFARTSGGSANQMRIFQESLKELGVLFGDVLLPEFTKIIKKVNEWLKKLKDLDPNQKELIVKLGLIAAAIGPVLIGLGSLSGAVLKVGSALRTANSLLGLGGGKGFLSLITKIPPHIAIFVAAMGALAAIQEKTTKELAPSLDFWERWKISMSSWTFEQEKQRLLEAEAAAQSLKTTLEYVNSIRPRPEMQGTGGEGLFGMGLLTSGPKETKPTIDLTPNVKGVEAITKGIAVIPMALEMADNSLKQKVQSFSASYVKMVDNANKFNEGFTMVIEGGLANMLSGIGELAGTAGATAGDLAKVLLGTIGGMAIQLGQLAIGIGVAIEGIKNALKSLNPVVAVAAGIALVALGTFVKGAASKIGSGGDRGKSSIPAFAAGGIVSGPTVGLMGEYPGAKTNPEVIAPLDKLQSMIGGAGGNVNVTGEFKLKGQDLVVAIQRADRERNRIN